MYRNRVIPFLLLSENGLVKTRQFKNPTYVGDPVNAVRIFNDKEVDELTILDIRATSAGRDPNYELISEIAGECFMPVGYGGGISSLDHMKKVFDCGVEKVCVNSVVKNFELISKAAAIFGSQSIVVSIDAKRRGFFSGYSCYARSGTEDLRVSPEELAYQAQEAGAGEIVINSIDNDGMMAGYDLKLIKTVASNVNIPVVAIGGAGKMDHLLDGLDAGASAVAAGSMFVFHGKHRAVLISYPKSSELSSIYDRKQ